MGALPDLARQFVLIALAAAPLALSLWALLDIASRPAWAWSLAQRRRVAWLAGVLLGTLSVVGGVVIATIYLLKVRPRIAAAEGGRLDLS